MPQLLVEVELVEKIEEPPDVAEEEERTHLKAEESPCRLVSTRTTHLWKIDSLDGEVTSVGN